MTARSDRTRSAGRDTAQRAGSAGTTDRRGVRRPQVKAPRHDEGTDRVARVGERVRAELADMLLRGEIREPAAKDAIVSAVVVTRDLSLARVYLRALGEADETRRRHIVGAFERARGHVRRELAARIARGSGAMRSVPELRFAWDDTADRVARLDAVFAEVSGERTPPASSDANTGVASTDVAGTGATSNTGVDDES